MLILSATRKSTQTNILLYVEKVRRIQLVFRVNYQPNVKKPYTMTGATKKMIYKSCYSPIVSSWNTL